MHALGFTYAEIGRMTGDTVRTVERQLRRSKETLRSSPGGELSRRELEVIDGLAAGESARRIAQRLGLGTSTVEDYIARAYRKLGVSTRREALAAHAARP
jgi:DNA-binding CsgD family transcriptional regulator